jgi:Carboxypeptidase regulatory-like domain
VLRIVGSALLLLTTAATQQLLREQPASIEGIVVKAGTSEPIGGATVELTGIATRSTEASSTVAPGRISVSVRESAGDGRVLSFTATTGSDGRFAIHDIPPAAGYQLVVMPVRGYLPAQYGQRVPNLPGSPITLSSDEQRKDIRIEMTPGATISGRVVNVAGRPLRNITVDLRRPWYLEGWRILVDWRETIPRVRGIGKSNRAAITRTNASGEFNFSGLAPAQYYVQTAPAKSIVDTPINLHAGATISNLEIVVGLTESDGRDRTIEGVVIDRSTGRRVESAQIRVFRPGVVPLYQSAQVEAGFVEGGDFEFSISAAGRYVLVATSDNRRAPFYGSKSIQVSDRDLTGVRIEVDRPFSLSGSVTVEGRVPAGLNTTPLALSLYPLLVETPSVRPTNIPVANGSFSVLGVVPGDYRVEVQPILTVPSTALMPPGLENAYVKSIRLGNRDILNEGLHLESRPDASLQIVIAMNGGTLDGRALDDNGKPVPNARVVLVPVTSRRQRGDLYKSVSTGDSGNFQLSGIAPGDYKLFAWERVEEGAWQDANFLSLYEDRGKAIRIGEGGRVTAEARVIPVWN